MRLSKIEIFPIVNMVMTIAVIITIVNRDFPQIGHDYGYHIPRMLDGHLHQRINGFLIQWYTPSFGGGLPAFPNPQDIQFSLPQILLFVLNPWVALMLTLIIYSAAGFICFYLLLKNECHFNTYASTFGSIFILTNGFMIEHALVGHVGFQSFPLLGCIIYLIFSKNPQPFPAGLLIGVVSAIIVNQSGFYIAFLFILSILVMLPLMYLVSPHLFQWKRLFVVLSTGGVSALLFSSSKLAAVYSFMRFFPREISDIHNVSYFEGLKGLVIQLAGGMFFIPYFQVTGRDFAELDTFFQKAIGVDSHIWETDISLSLILILILMFGFIKIFMEFIKQPLRRGKLSLPNIIATIFLFLGVWLVTDFSLSKGILFDHLKPLPILRSLHVNVRYTSAFIFPFSFLGAYFLTTFIPLRRSIYLWITSLIAAFLPFLYLLPPSQVFHLASNANPSMQIYAQIEDGEKFPITTIQNLKDINIFKKQASNIKNIFEPVFGYDLEYFNPLVYPGSIFETENGYYNMTNPASYVFPTENGLTAFERFELDQEADLILFVNRYQPLFNISSTQHVANWVNLISILVAGVFLIMQFFLGLIKPTISTKYIFNGNSH